MTWIDRFQKKRADGSDGLDGGSGRYGRDGRDGLDGPSGRYVSDMGGREWKV